MVPPLLVLALEFHRAPLRFRHLTDPEHPLPEAFDVWLTEASAALAPDNATATAEVLGTAIEPLRGAYLFLLRQMLLPPKADHYRVLGASRGCSAECIKQHHSLLVRLFHPDRLPEDDEQSLLFTVRINAAYQVLRDPQVRRRYDSQLPPLSAGVPARGEPSDFFRADGPFARAQGFTRVPVFMAHRRRHLLYWTLGFVALIALMVAILHEPRRPLLVIDPDLAVGMPQVGSSANGGVASSAQSESGDQGGIDQRPAQTQESLSTGAPRADMDVRGPSEPAQPGSDINGSASLTTGQGGQAQLAVESGKTSGPPMVHVAKSGSDIDGTASVTTGQGGQTRLAVESGKTSVPPVGHVAKAGSGIDGSASVTTGQDGQARLAVESGTTSRPAVVHVPVAATKEKVPDPPAHATVSASREKPPKRAAASDALELKKPAPNKPKRPRNNLPEGADRESGSRENQPQGIAKFKFLSRLERTFASGDLVALAGLFTANAVLNNGVGAVGVRNTYSGIVGHAGRGRLTVSSLKWRTGKQGRLLGKGTIRVSTIDASQRESGDLSGSVEIELVPWMGDYRISKLIHHLPRR